MHLKSIEEYRNNTCISTYEKRFQHLNTLSILDSCTVHNSHLTKTNALPSNQQERERTRKKNGASEVAMGEKMCIKHIKNDFILK